MAEIDVGFDVNEARAFPGVMHFVRRSYSLAGAFTNNDEFINFVSVPIGLTVRSVRLVIDSMDTDGSPAVLVDVGDLGSKTRFISGDTVAQAGGSVLVENIHYTYDVERDIRVRLRNAVTPASTGDITIELEYYWT